MYPVASFKEWEAADKRLKEAEADGTMDKILERLDAQLLDRGAI